MLVHSLASKYARFVVIVRQMYWTPPFRPLDPPLLKSDDLFLGNQEILDPPLSKILDTPLKQILIWNCLAKYEFIICLLQNFTKVKSCYNPLRLGTVIVLVP